MTTNEDGATYRATIEKEVREVANSCDLGNFNADYFMSSSFVSNIADLVQEKERLAYKRGLTKNSLQ